MLAIACSANIGSAMTFTGNPQNIIISNHLSGLMSGGLFFGLMLLPALIGWLTMTVYLNYRRLICIRRSIDQLPPSTDLGTANGVEMSPISETSAKKSVNSEQPAEALPEISTREQLNCRTPDLNNDSSEFAEFPAVACAGFAALIALEFAGLDITAIFCSIAVLLAAIVLIANFSRGYPLGLTRKQRIDGIARYTEELFDAIDYNLIFIFIGLFVISGAFVSTLIPRVYFCSIIAI